MGKRITEEEALRLGKEVEQIKGITFIGFSKEGFQCSKSLLYFNCYDHGEFIYDYVQTKIKSGNGRICPRCSGSGKLKQEERVLRSRMACDNLNLNFRYCGEDLGYKTRIYYTCNTCGNSNSSRLGNLEHGKGCPKCKSKTISEKRSNHPKLLKSLKFIASSKNLAIISLEKVLAGNSGFKRTFITYKCENCNTIGKAHGKSHFESLKGCTFCNGNYVRNQEELESLAKESISLRKYQIAKSGLITEYKYTKSRLNIICPNGHDYKPTFDKFVRCGIDCPCIKKCGFSIDKPAYFYILKFNLQQNTCIKFGITNNLKRRIRELERSHLETQIEVVHYFQTIFGKNCKALEETLKSQQKFWGGSFLKHGDGYTETVSYEHLEKILEIVKYYEKSLLALDTEMS